MGLSVDVVSVGSTPTACHADDLSGITEMRPGNYALFDMYQAHIGSCQSNEIALSVLTEVIGVYPNRNQILVDAGALALSKDAGAIHSGSEPSFGLVCDLNCHPIPGLTVASLSQEHGKIVVDDSYQSRPLKVGDRLRILPNHSCLVTALFKELNVVENDVVIDRWQPVRGW